MTPDPHQGELFTVVDTPVQTPKRPTTSTPKPRWSKYRPKHPVKCDDCMLLLAVTKGNAPASRQAKWRRKQGASDLLLCYAHATARRTEDGLEPLGGGA